MESYVAPARPCVQSDCATTVAAVHSGSTADLLRRRRPCMEWNQCQCLFLAFPGILPRQATFAAAISQENCNPTHFLRQLTCCRTALMCHYFANVAAAITPVRRKLYLDSLQLPCPLAAASFRNPCQFYCSILDSFLEFCRGIPPSAAVIGERKRANPVSQMARFFHIYTYVVYVHMCVVVNTLRGLLGPKRYYM